MTRAAPNYTGGCACGAVRLEISAKPLIARQCWCGQCQKLAGGGPMHNAFFPTGALVVTGEITTAIYVANSGNRMTFSFCPRCGTQLFAGAEARPHLRAVRFGAIDTPNDLRPAMAIWTQSAPEWAVIDPALDQYATQPPPPPS